MTPKALDATKIIRKEVLLAEYLRLCSDIRSIETNNEKLLGFGFTLISLAAVVGIAQQVDEIFLLLPIAVVGTLAYVGTSYNALYSMAGYKKFLEELINGLVDERLLTWESLAHTREARSINSRLLWLIYFIVALSIWALSINRVAADKSIITAVALGGATAVLVFVLWAGLRQMQGTKEYTYERARALHLNGQSQEAPGSIGIGARRGAASEAAGS